MKLTQFYPLALLLIICLLQTACKDDDEPTPITCPDEVVTYEQDIKAIVDASCAYSGCHDSSNPDVPHNYTTYDGMLIVLENGRLEDRVIDKMEMPPSDQVPDGKPKNLTASQINLIQCWLEDGHPEM